MSSRPSRGAARLAAILDALPDALLLVNANGTVVNANSIALETFESPGCALVGRGLLDLLPSFDPRRIPGSMRRPEDDAGRTKPTRMVARRTDGSEFPVEVTSASLDDSRTPFADTYSYTGDELLMLVVRDLTGTLDTEAELARQQRQTEMILRAASEGVIGVDTEGKVVLVNPAAAQILGYRATDLGGKALHPLIHHSRRDGSPLPWDETPLADTLRSGLKHRARGRVLWRKDGRAVPVDLITAPVREGDQLVGAVMTFTDRSRYDALAARYAHLQAVLDTSLREPLEGLRGELSALASDPAGTLWPEANQILRHLTAGYGRIRQLVDNVLSFQQLDRGERKIELETTSLDKIVEAGVEDAVELIGPGRAQFAVHAPPIEATVDPARMAQALAHLIADVAGVDAAGNVPLTSTGDSTIVVAAAQRGDVVRIEVRGPQAGGDPVHLPIARGIVERHGGVLQTHRMPGPSGSTSYVLEVPHTPSAAQARGAKQKEPARESETTVMPVPAVPVRGTNAAQARTGGQAAGQGPGQEHGRPAPPEARAQLRVSSPAPSQAPPAPLSPAPALSPPSAEHAAAPDTDGGRGQALVPGQVPVPAPLQAQTGVQAAAAGDTHGGHRAVAAGEPASVPLSVPAQASAPAAGDTPTGRRRALRRPEPEHSEVPESAEANGATTGRRARRALPEQPSQDPAQQYQQAAPPQPQWPDANNSTNGGGQRSAIVDPRRLPDRSQTDDTAAALAIEAVLNSAKSHPDPVSQNQVESPAPQAGSPVAGPVQPPQSPSPQEQAASAPPAVPSAPSALSVPSAPGIPEQVQRHPVPTPQVPQVPTPHVPQARQPLASEPHPPVPQQQQQSQPDPSSQSQSISVRTLGQGIALAQAQMSPPAPVAAPQQPHEPSSTGSGRRRRLGAPAEDAARPHPANPATAQEEALPQPPAQRQSQSQAAPYQPEAQAQAQPPIQVQAEPQLQSEPQFHAQAQLRLQTPPQAQPPAPGNAQPQPDPTDPVTTMLRPVAPGRAYAIGAPAEGAAEGPEPLDGPNGAIDVTPESPLEPRRLLVWPEPDVSTRQALSDRGYQPVVVRSREEVEAQVTDPPAALFVDPLTGPITRTALQSLRQAAAQAEVPVLVTAGLGQATREAAYGADPAVLLKALAPRDSEQHPPRVLLVEGHPPIAQAFIATLERRGMQVAHALSEAEAMTLAAQIHPNLVVMDLMLVHRRGHSIVDWLRANGRLHRTPLVVYTAVDIDPAELPRLASGETVLFLAERSTSTDVQSRIVDVLAKISS